MRIGIVSVILISITSYGLFFYLQSINGQSIRENIFNSQLSRQLESTKAITQHIGSDLRLVVAMLQDLADSIYLQQGYLSGDNTSRLLDEKFLQLNTVTKVDGLFIADNEDVITIHKVAKGLRSFVNIDISSREYVNQTKSTLRPVFSNGFEWIDSKYKITITYPICRANGKYLGLLAAQIPTVKFFENYGNVYDVNSQFLVAYDRNANILAVGASKDLVGKHFFGNYTQNFVNNNRILNDLIHDLVAGKGGYAVYDYGKGERLNTQSPILVVCQNSRQPFSIQDTKYTWSRNTACSLLVLLAIKTSFNYPLREFNTTINAPKLCCQFFSILYNAVQETFLTILTFHH